MMKMMTLKKVVSIPIREYLTFCDSITHSLF